MAGRPVEWTPEKMAEAKELYLALLREGKNEREIDEVDGVPSHQYRSKWMDKPEFVEQCRKARALGATKNLAENEALLDRVFEKAWDDAASPALVSVMKEKMSHARWLAARMNKEVYGESVNHKHSGDAENPVQIVSASDKDVLAHFVKTRGKDYDDGTES